MIMLGTGHSWPRAKRSRDCRRARPDRVPSQHWSTLTLGPVVGLHEVLQSLLVRYLTTRLADVAAIQSRPAWITEGIYLGWVDELFRSSDAIVWLDVPWYAAAWRIVVRHARASLAGNNQHDGLGKLIRFVRASQRYYMEADTRLADADDGAVTRAHTANALTAYRGKVVRCTNSGELRALLRRFR